MSLESVRRVKSALFIVLFLVLSSGGAYAQQSYNRAVGDVERYLMDARRAYENFEIEQAESDLQRAIRIIDQFDMRTPEAADVFVQMGIVVYAKRRDARKTTKYFERAFEADPQAVLDRNSANPSMEKLFEEARLRVQSRQPRGFSGNRRQERGGYDRDSDRRRGPSGRRDRGNAWDNDRGSFDTRRNRYDEPRYDRSGTDRRGGYDERGGQNRDTGWGDYGESSRSRRGGRGGFDDNYGGRDAPREKLEHRAPKRAPSDTALELWVTVDPEANREIYQLFIYYQSAATRAPQKGVMRAAGATDFRVTIPRRYVIGREFSYYFVAESRSGRKVATLRSARSPFRVKLSGDILGGASSLATGSSLDNLDSFGDGGQSDGGLTLAISAGSGVGFVTQKSRPVLNTMAVLETEGLAPAPFHLNLDMDGWISKTVSLGAFGRIQIVEFATLFGGRLQFRVAQSRNSESRLRIGGGYGNIRHLVKIQTKNDTTLDGPYCVTGGYAYLYKLSSSMKFKTAIDYLQLFGTSPSYHLDFSLGIELGF